MFLSIIIERLQLQDILPTTHETKSIFQLFILFFYECGTANNICVHIASVSHDANKPKPGMLSPT